MEAELLAVREENVRLRGLLGLDERAAGRPVQPWRPTFFESIDAAASNTLSVNQHSDAKDKVALFRPLFRGRDYVHARRWDNERNGKSGWSPAVRGGWVNARKSDREYLPYDEDVVDRHLADDIHAGVYPLRRGDTCRLLACDFDGPGWVLDALAYLDAARAAGVPAALERSRSGDGGHVWIFFDGDVPAASARRIGVHLLRDAMTIRAELDLVSYDRLFPAQDFMPKGSFGNLIALPLQGNCRKRGTTMFLDPTNLEPYPDQWAFLSSLQRLEAQAASELANLMGELAAGPDTAIYRSPGIHGGPKPPATITAKAMAMLAIDRIGMPPAMLAALKRLASLHNPDF